MVKILVHSSKDFILVGNIYVTTALAFSEKRILFCEMVITHELVFLVP